MPSSDRVSDRGCVHVSVEFVGRRRLRGHHRLQGRFHRRLRLAVDVVQARPSVQMPASVRCAPERRHRVGGHRRSQLLLGDVGHPVAEVVAAEAERHALDEGGAAAAAGPLIASVENAPSPPAGRCRRRARPACRSRPPGRRRARSSWCRGSGVISAYRLFWQTKTIGRSHSAAMFAASWNEPVLVAPSPKLTTVTRSRPLRLAAIASPTATGGPAPTIPVESITPVLGFGDVHGAALAAARADGAAHHLAVDLFQRNAFADQVVQSAVGGDQLVVSA